MKSWAALLEEQLPAAPADIQALFRQNPPWYENVDFVHMMVDAATTAFWRNNINRWRVYCLTPHPDSLLMWSHYADKHKGICLEFDATCSPMGEAWRVSYQETFQFVGPQLLQDPMELVRIALLNKASVWNYEDEYRVLARPTGLDENFRLTTEQDYLSLPIKSLKSVIVGCNGPAKAVESLVREHQPTLPVKQAVRMPEKYSLVIERRHPA